MMENTVPWKKVAVAFRPRHLSELAYALDVAQALSVPLDVYVRGSGDTHSRLRGYLLRKDERQVNVSFETDMRHGDLVGTLVVTNDATWLTRHDVDVLFCREAKQFSLYDEQPRICVPFGAREGGQVAMQIAASLAGALRAELAMYHTTWTDGKRVGSDPRDQMSDATNAVMCSMMKCAERVTQTARSVVIEARATVTDGIAQYVIREKVSLVVMARNPGTTIGYHADQFFGHSAVPLLVCRMAQGRSS